MKSFFAFAAVVAAMSMPMAHNAFAGDVTSGDLTISDPMARPNLPNRPTAAYMVISNASEADDRLLSASSPAFGKVEFHTVLKDGDVMKMELVKDVVVPAGDSAVLKAGGYHLMLFDAAKLLKNGDTFPVTLSFETAGDIEVLVKVDRKAGQGHGHADHNAHGAKTGHGGDDQHSGHGGHKDGEDGHGAHKHDGKSE